MPALVRPPVPLRVPTSRSVPAWALRAMVRADSPKAKPFKSKTPPLSVTVAFSVPAPPVRTMLPARESVPPLTLMAEVTVRPVPALAIFTAVPVPAPKETAPPVMLIVEVTVPPALVLMAIATESMSTTPPPKLSVAVALPLPVLVRLAAVSVVISSTPWSKEKVAVAAAVALLRAAIVMVPIRRSAAWPAKSAVAAILTPVVPVVLTRLTVVRDAPSEARRETVPVTSAGSNWMVPLERMPAPAEPMLSVSVRNVLAPEPRKRVWLKSPPEASPTRIVAAVIVLIGARRRTEAGTAVDDAPSPTRNVPAPRLAVKLASPVRLTLAALPLVSPVAPPTWKLAPPELTTMAPPPLKVTFVAEAAALAPSVTAPFTVKVLPAPTTMEARPDALGFEATRPPIVWLKAPASRVAVSAPVVALPRTSAALGEKVLSAEPVTLPATTRTLPELRLVVFVKVSVPRPALVRPSLLALFARKLSTSVKPMEASVVEVTSVTEVPSR